MGYKQTFLMVGLLLVTSLTQGETNSTANAHHHGHHGHDHGVQDQGHHAHQGLTLAGKPGRSDQVDRVIQVEASDQMRFLHEPIRVRAGETIEFRVTNTGRIPHEFVVGVKREHAEHRIQMRNNPTMIHDEPNSVTLSPGETRTLIWTFAESREIELACNIPGHYEAGMYSPVEVESQGEMEQRRDD